MRKYLIIITLLLLTSASNSTMYYGAGYQHKLKMQEFNASGTWIRPSGVETVRVFMCGGGGGGGYGDINWDSAGSGGGSSQLIDMYVPVSGNVNVVVGSGGNGGATYLASGSDGGNTSFGSIVATGGKGGRNGLTPAGTRNYGNGGGRAYTSSNTTRHLGGLSFSIYTTAGTDGSDNSTQGGDGGNGLFTGGAGGVGYGAAGGGGGGGGGFYPGISAGTPFSGGTGGTGYGAGGGGANRNSSGAHAGGNGAQGICVVYWWE